MSPVGNKKKYLIYECGKTYIEIGTALCLLGNIYEPSYLKRSKAFNVNFERSFPKISKKVPYLSTRIESFTNIKLFPTNGQYEDFDSINLWFESSNDLVTTLKYYAEKWLGIEVNDNSSFSKKYYENLKQEYYKEMIRYYLKMRFGLNHDWFIKMMNVFYLKFYSFKYFISLYKKRGIFYPRVFFESPLLKLYSIIPLFLLSLNKDGSLNEQLFSNVIDELNKVYPVDKTILVDNDKWEVLKMCLLNAVDLYEGQR